MDWERLEKKLNMFLLCMLLTVFGLSVTVEAYTPYDSGNLSTTYISYFDDILNKYPFDNYVIWRDTQYNYCLALGDIEYTSNSFTADEVKLFTIDTGQNYNSSYRLYRSTIQNFSLTNSNNSIVYSDLGFYPTVNERGSNYESSLLLIVFIACIFVLARDILKVSLSV